MAETFTVNEEHLRLLRRAYVRWEDCEFGAPAIDCKRPYGNSSVIADMAEILGVDPVGDDEELPRDVEDRLTQLHRETETVLQIILSTGRMEPGQYESPRWGQWRRSTGRTSAGQASGGGDDG